MKLNLGCGNDYRQGYVNVDLRTDCETDLVSDVTKLPYEDGEVDEILALDLLEHFPVFRTLDILSEWRRVLKLGGLLAIKVPNLEELSKALLARARPDMVVRNIYGGHRWGPDGAWDTHHTGWTPSMIRRDLELGGFRLLSNDVGLNMTVKAAKA